MDKRQSRPFCIAPWVVFATVTNGHVKPCCDALMDGQFKKEDGALFNLAEDSIESIWNSNDIRKLRTDFINGDSREFCFECIEYEKLGKTSKRQNFFKDYYDDGLAAEIDYSAQNDGASKSPPIEFDLRLGNLCNLRCGSCDARKSSPLLRERKKLLNENAFKSSELSSIVQADVDEATTVGNLNWQKNKEFWHEMLEMQPKQIAFYGGEPLLNKEAIESIQELAKEDRSSEVSIKISTNGTIMPENLMESLAKFKEVIIHYSIDGHKEVNEYLRNPSKWTAIERNLLALLTNRKLLNTDLKVFIISTVQALNLLQLKDLYRWVEEVKLQIPQESKRTLVKLCWNALFIPNFLSISALPDSARKLALAEIDLLTEETQNRDLSSLRRFVASSKYDENKNKLLKEYCQTLDSSRGTDVNKLLVADYW